MPASGSNRLVQSMLEKTGEATMAKGLVNANEEAKKKDKGKKKKK